MTHVMPTRDEIARIIWTVMERGEVEGRDDQPLDCDYEAADAVLALFQVHPSCPLPSVIQYPK